IAGVQRSNQQRQQADQNRDYQYTVNKDAARMTQHHGGQHPEPAVETPEPSRGSSGIPRSIYSSTIKEELLNLNSNHVYETVPIPEGVTPITSKPVFCIKRNHTGNVKRYKAHIVA
ncbi:hypothetical protein PAXRUDRAFT_46330, partial [Paxillus rubicundulus Ve08.2h10]